MEIKQNYNCQKPFGVLMSFCKTCTDKNSTPRNDKN